MWFFVSVINIVMLERGMGMQLIRPIPLLSNINGYISYKKHGIQVKVNSYAIKQLNVVTCARRVY